MFTASEVGCRVVCDGEITQSCLRKVLKLRKQKKDLTKQLADLEKEVVKELKAGTPVHEGKLDALIEKTLRVSPKYKDELIKAMGQDYVDQVIKSTPASASETLKVG